MPDYIALLRKEPDSDYGVDFPDFPGCVTAGSTLDEARRMAEEALRFHIDGMIEDGEDVPPPSSLERVMADETNRDAVAFLVSVPERQGRAVRVNITLPENVLAEVDRFVSEHGLTRSGFLARAAEKALKESA
jgi:predicted RNase H-like HicB family nuclease